MHCLQANAFGGFEHDFALRPLGSSGFAASASTPSQSGFSSTATLPLMNPGVRLNSSNASLGAPAGHLHHLGGAMSYMGTPAGMSRYLPVAVGGNRGSQESQQSLDQQTHAQASLDQLHNAIRLSAAASAQAPLTSAHGGFSGASAGVAGTSQPTVPAGNQLTMSMLSNIVEATPVDMRASERAHTSSGLDAGNTAHTAASLLRKCDMCCAM